MRPREGFWIWGPVGFQKLHGFKLFGLPGMQQDVEVIPPYGKEGIVPQVLSSIIFANVFAVVKLLGAQRIRADP